MKRFMMLGIRYKILHLTTHLVLQRENLIHKWHMDTTAFHILLEEDFTPDHWLTTTLDILT